MIVMIDMIDMMCWSGLVLFRKYHLNIHTCARILTPYNSFIPLPLIHIHRYQESEQRDRVNREKKEKDAKDVRAYVDYVD